MYEHADTVLPDRWHIHIRPKYESFDLNRLKAELDSLSRRESQLVVAQNQRYKTSEMQAFWWGFGQGDGIEASELASVRGQIEGVRKAIAIKQASSAEPAIKKD